MTMQAMHNPIIVALDVESAEDARAMVARIGPRVNFYKVGLELYAAAGMDVVKELLGQGKQVFLDLKMYDIPGDGVARGGAGGEDGRPISYGTRGGQRDARGGGSARGQQAADSRRHRTDQFRAGGHGRSGVRRNGRRIGGAAGAQGGGTGRGWRGGIAARGIGGATHRGSADGDRDAGRSLTGSGRGRSEAHRDTGPGDIWTARTTW